MSATYSAPTLVLQQWTPESSVTIEEHYRGIFIPTIRTWAHNCTPANEGFLSDFIEVPENLTPEQLQATKDKLKVPPIPTPLNPADIPGSSLPILQYNATLLKAHRDEIIHMRSTIASGKLAILTALDPHTRRMLFPTDADENAADINAIIKGLQRDFATANAADVNSNLELLRIPLAGPDKVSYQALVYRHRECHLRAARQGMPISDAHQALHIRTAVTTSPYAAAFHSQLSSFDFDNQDPSLHDFKTIVNTLSFVQFSTTPTPYAANAAAATATPTPLPPPRPNNHRNPQFPTRPNNFPRPQAFPRPYQPPRQQNIRPPRPPAAQPPRTFANTYFCWSHGDGHSSEFCRTPEDDHLDYLTHTTPQQIAHRRAELPAIRAAIAASRQR